MKRNDLLMPYAYKKIGWVLLGMGVLFLMIWLTTDGQFDFSINSIRSLLGMEPIKVENYITGLSGFNAETGMLNTLTTILILIGSLLVGFSRCKNEDEFTQFIRYRAMTIVFIALIAMHLIMEVCFWGFNYLLIRNFAIKVTPIVYILCFYIMVLMERRRNEE